MIDVVELNATPPARITKARCSCCQTILHHNARTRAYYRTVGDAVAGRRALRACPGCYAPILPPRRSRIQ